MVGHQRLNCKIFFFFFIYMYKPSSFHTCRYVYFSVSSRRYLTTIKLKFVHFFGHTIFNININMSTLSVNSCQVYNDTLFSIKVYFLWICPSHKHFEWFIDVLRDVEKKDVTNVLEIHIFITQFFHKFDLRTTMLVRVNYSVV